MLSEKVPCRREEAINGNPLQSSCLENPMDGGAWWAAVHGVARVLTQQSDFTFTFHFHALEKEMATRSSVPAWRTPGTAEPGGLPSMGSHRVGHDWSDLAAAAALEKGVVTNSSIHTHTHLLHIHYIHLETNTIYIRLYIHLHFLLTTKVAWHIHCPVPAVT